MATAAAASSGTLPNVQGEKDAPPGLLPWVEKYRPVTLNDVSESLYVGGELLCRALVSPVPLMPRTA